MRNNSNFSFFWDFDFDYIEIAKIKEIIFLHRKKYFNFEIHA